MNQKIGFLLHRAAQQELVLRSMQSLAGLISHDPAPAETRKMLAHFGRAQAQIQEIVPRRQGHAFHAPADVILAGFGLDPRQRHAGRIGQRHFGLRVGGPDFGDMQNRGHHAFAVAQCHGLAGAQFLSRLFRHNQHHRTRPEQAIRQFHFGQHTVPLGLIHVTGQRRQRTVEQQFQFADLLPVQIQRRQRQRFLLDLGDALGTGQQAFQLAAIRGDQAIHTSIPQCAVRPARLRKRRRQNRGCGLPARR